MVQDVVTEFTRMFNLRIPIVSAPMWRAASVELAAAITASGGLGMLGAGWDTSETIGDRVAHLRHELQKPSTNASSPSAPASHFPTQPEALIGYGFLGWTLDLTEPSTSKPGEVWDPRLPAYLDQQPDLTWLAFGNDLGRHIAYIRAYQAEREFQTKVFVNVNTVEEALIAANEWEADGIIVQGIEAGGHGSSSSPPLTEFLRAVLQALPLSTPSNPRPIILAAGGLTTGEDVARMLLEGADGAVMGTRFLLTTECSWPASKKEALAKVVPGSNKELTRRTRAFDGIIPLPAPQAPEPNWPDHIDGRAIANQVYRDIESGMGVEERRKRVKEGMEKGDPEFLVLWAGTGAGKVNKVVGAKEVMKQLHSETVSALQKASAHHLLADPSS